MSPLDRLAARASFRPSFLGHALGVYQVFHGLTDAALCAELGCTAAALTRLRLCGLPRVDRFADDCRVIADHCGCRVEAIERICWPW